MAPTAFHIGSKVKPVLNRSDLGLFKMNPTFVPTFINMVSMLYQTFPVDVQIGAVTASSDLTDH